MTTSTIFARRIIVLIAAVTLAACGGGGGGDDGNSAANAAAAGTNGSTTTDVSTNDGGTGTTGNSGNELTDAAQQQAGTDSIDTNSYWTMDGYHYTNGGYSTQGTSPTARGVETIVAVSTATMSGGTNPENGAYRGSGLQFVFTGNAPGTFRVVPTREEYVVRSGRGDQWLILISVQIGTGVTTGSASYLAQSGRVKVTRDDNGKFHLSSVDSLPAVKEMNLGNGIEGAPNRMQLKINNAY